MNEHWILRFELWGFYRGWTPFTGPPIDVYICQLKMYIKLHYTSMKLKNFQYGGKKKLHAQWHHQHPRWILNLVLTSRLVIRTVICLWCKMRNKHTQIYLFKWLIKYVIPLNLVKLNYFLHVLICATNPTIVEIVECCLLIWHHNVYWACNI